MDIEHGIEAVRNKKGAGYAILSRPSQSIYEEQGENKQDNVEARLHGDDSPGLSELFALQQFYSQSFGRGWRRQDGWKTFRDGVDVHEGISLWGWSGVTVGRRGQTREIRLPDNNLQTLRCSSLSTMLWFGRQRWRLLMNLKFITVLDLSRNKLKGRIPKVLAQLESLEDLNLDMNSFRGTIPAELGQLRQLRYLRLSKNILRGTIPAELGQLFYLRVLSLSHNRLSGRIPEEVKRLRDLEHLDCSDNYLSGVIDAWACMSTVYADDRHTNPTMIYVYLIDAFPRPMVGVQILDREEEAQSRAEGWMRWYLNKLQQRQQEEGRANTPSRPRLCETRIQRMFSPYFPKVSFAVKTREGKTRVFPRKTLNIAVPTVVGSATGESKLEDFRHLVVFHENTIPAGAPTILPRFNPNQPHGRDDNAPDGPGGRHQSRLQGTGEVNVYEYTSVNTGSAPAYIRRRHRLYLGARDINLVACLIWIPMGPSFLVSAMVMWFFSYDFYATYPVPAFWATLVVLVIIFLCDVAAQRSRRFSLATIAGFVCRALLYGCIFGLINSGPDAAAGIVAGICALFIVPGIYFCITYCVIKSCFELPRYTLLLTVDPVDVTLTFM